MPREVFLFDPPERFVAGTVGEPGSRQFFLQARTGARLVSVSLEKQQVSVLAERLEQLLGQIQRATGVEVAPPARPDSAPLEAPIEDAFNVFELALAWEGDAQTVLIEAHGMLEDPDRDASELDDDEDGPPVLRLRITTSQAKAFVVRARVVVAAGRPPCPFCTLPLDPSGHICPRANGYRRRV